MATPKRGSHAAKHNRAKTLMKGMTMEWADKNPMPVFPEWVGWNERTLKAMYFYGEFWLVDNRSATDVSGFDYNEEW